MSNTKLPKGAYLGLRFKTIHTIYMVIKPFHEIALQIMLIHSFIQRFCINLLPVCIRLAGKMSGFCFTIYVVVIPFYFNIEK